MYQICLKVANDKYKIMLMVSQHPLHNITSPKILLDDNSLSCPTGLPSGDNYRLRHVNEQLGIILGKQRLNPCCVNDIVLLSWPFQKNGKQFGLTKVLNFTENSKKSQKSSISGRTKHFILGIFAKS